MRGTRATDAFLLVPKLRTADVLEAKLLGMDPQRELVDGVICSRWALTLERNYEPIAIFGVRQSGHSREVGVPWFVGSNEVAKCGRALQRWSPVYIAAMLHQFPTLANVVHADNAVALRWLRRSGFRVEAARPVRAGWFHPFSMVRQ